MSRADDPTDTLLQIGGVLVRGGAYALVLALAERYSLAQPLLAGAFVGDLMGRGTALVCEWRTEWLRIAGDLLLLGAIGLFAGDQLAWPHDPTSRAIAELSGMGVFFGTSGRTLLRRFRPDSW